MNSDSRTPSLFLTFSLTTSISIFSGGGGTWNPCCVAAARTTRITKSETPQLLDGGFSLNDLPTHQRQPLSSLIRARISQCGNIRLGATTDMIFTFRSDCSHSVPPSGLLPDRFYYFTKPPLLCVHPRPLFWVYDSDTFLLLYAVPFCLSSQCLLTRFALWSCNPP